MLVFANVYCYRYGENVNIPEVIHTVAGSESTRVHKRLVAHLGEMGKIGVLFFIHP